MRCRDIRELAAYCRARVATNLSGNAESGGATAFSRAIQPILSHLRLSCSIIP